MADTITNALKAINDLLKMVEKHGSEIVLLHKENKKLRERVAELEERKKLITINGACTREQVRRAVRDFKDEA